MNELIQKLSSFLLISNVLLGIEKNQVAAQVHSDALQTKELREPCNATELRLFYYHRDEMYKCMERASYSQRKLPLLVEFYCNSL